MSAKTLIVGERYIPNNPWRSDLVKRQYEVALQEAQLEHQKRFPNSLLKVLTTFDSGPSEGFALAKKEQALAVTGYFYSSEALESAALAEKNKLPFLTAVSPLSGVHNDYAYSLAMTHDQMKAKLAELRNKPEFNHPSVVILPQTSMSNYEYARIYQDAFDVVKVYSGKTPAIWDQFSQDLRLLLTKSQMINVLFAGYAYEHIDLVKLLASGSHNDKLNIIGHAQWTYCPRLLRVNLKDIKANLYAFSDYFDPPLLRAANFPVSSDVLGTHESVAKTLNREPDIKDHDPKEPIVYALRDMLSIAMQVAEASNTREEYRMNFSKLRYIGAVTEYEISDRISYRKVYLGKWQGSEIKPFAQL